MSMHRSISAVCICLLLHLSAAGLFAQSPATQSAAAFPIPIVQLHGSSADMGSQQGQRLAAPIKLLHEKYLTVFLGSPTKRVIAIAAARAFERHFLPEHLAEVTALARQSGVDTDETALGQCFLDLAAMSACSTITLPAEASPDHIARFGRDLDFPSLDVADKYTTILVFRPDDGRFQFVSIGWPGMIGVLSGMNEHGLSLANMEVARPPLLPMAMPYTLLYRTVLERCKTVDEAIALLEKTARQTPNNLMLMDAAGHRAVVEIKPSSITVRRGEEAAALISTNHQRGQDASTPGRCERYDFLSRASHEEFGHVDKDALQKMLAGASQGDMTLQSMVFEPSNRVIYLSAGRDAAHGVFHRLDLREYFSK
ncbi:MAG TPA: C45 family peptidase [Tepidisphaeraceae bacterium]|jgi:predicted choloylglycine hydrolase|nr:C45 family peptidase [Tepidisphaeraceae bacterium]